MKPKHHLRSLATLAALFGAFAGTVVSRVEWPPEHREVPTKQREIESDLFLHAELKSGKVLPLGTNPWIELTLVNTSRAVTHRVIKPDPAMERRLEPHLYWTGTIDRGDGRFVPIEEERKYSYCGHSFDRWNEWPKNAIEFPPGARIPLDIQPRYEFQQAGRIRLQAHYDYRAGLRKLYPRFTPEVDSELLVGLPEFHIVSNPIEFEVVRTLELRLTVKGPLKANRQTPLADLFDLTLANVSKAPVECTAPLAHADPHVNWIIVEGSRMCHPRLTLELSQNRFTKPIAPGERVSLLGPGEFANGHGGTLTSRDPGRIRVRAEYVLVRERWSQIMSDWVDLQVEERPPHFARAGRNSASYNRV